MLIFTSKIPLSLKKKIYNQCNLSYLHMEQNLAKKGDTRKPNLKGIFLKQLKN